MTVTRRGLGGDADETARAESLRTRWSPALYDDDEKLLVEGDEHFVALRAESKVPASRAAVGVGERRARGGVWRRTRDRHRSSFFGLRSRTTPRAFLESCDMKSA